MTLTEYITNDGDRLDLIANKAYGDPFNWAPILDNNPALPVQAIYEAGIRIIVPVEIDQTVTETDFLPPWKR
jgi:phage tail protein X